MKKIVLFFTVILVMLFCGLPYASADSISAGNVCEEYGNSFCSVFFVNTGKSDCILVKAGEHAYMIDSGTKDAVVSVFSAMNVLGISKLDGLFISHTHDDHSGGMGFILNTVAVDTVYRAGFSEVKKNGNNVIDTKADKANVPVNIICAGDRVFVSENVYFDVLGPLCLNEKDDNDNSLVLMLYANGTRYLFTGDMQFAEEETLLNSSVDLHADVLKIGNHGNPDATGKKFFQHVNPSYAVICTDRNTDRNSANSRILDMCTDCMVYITDETERGVLFEQNEDGTLRITDPVKKSAGEYDGLKLESCTEQSVSIRNSSDFTVDLSGCMLYSYKGNDFLLIQDGFLLSSCKSVSVTGKKGNGELVFDSKKPLKGDSDQAVVLFDPFGNIIDIIY